MGESTYSWNPLGQLVRVVTPKGTTEYAYDYTGQRASKRVIASGKELQTHYIDKVAEIRDGKLLKYVFMGDARVARLGGIEPTALSIAGFVLGPFLGIASLMTLLLALGVAFLAGRKRALQYRSLAVGKRCKEMGIRPSLGSVGDAYDNAMCESFFATLEHELLKHRRFKTQAEARVAVFTYVEGFYNLRRRHSALDDKPPVAYERKHHSSMRRARNN